MEPIFVIAITLVSITLLKIIFKISTKKVEPLKEDKDLEKLTDKFPENIKIAEEMLQMLGNKTVKIEQAQSTQTNLYIAVSNKILIADMKNNYARIQTIAHECLHSVQDRRLLLFNFIFSNIIILYWLIITILTIIGIITNIAEPTFILLLLATIKLAVRGLLEIEAITKAKYLAKEYMENKKLLSNEEINSILNKYEQITKISGPFTIANILVGSFIGILVYSAIALIKI